MEHIFNLLDHYGLWLGFVLVAIENISVPFPIEFVYLYSQDLINTDRTTLPLMLIYFTLAHMTGATVAYFIGRAGNSFIAERFKHNAGVILTRNRVEKWYKKYGSFTNFITRLVGYVRPWSSLVAGFGKENFYTFFGWSFLGSLLFNIIAILFSGSILYFWSNYSFAKYIITGGFVFFFILIWLLFPWLSKKFKF